MVDSPNGAEASGGMSEDDKMAAAWAAAADGSDNRVLSQNEIDSLLGVANDGDDGNKSGIKAIINSALVSYERLPMLEVVFDRLFCLLSASLTHFISPH